MEHFEYTKYDGMGLAELVRNKEIKPIELVDAAIARIERMNPDINAVVWTMFDGAREMAKSVLPKGLFSGVPFLLKDIRGGMKGVPTRAGSRFIPPTPAPSNSTLVSRYLDAGLIPLGKTNVSELGLLPTTETKLYGAARNPWNLKYTVGGSSGGSGAAVASGMVPVAHANDGGGSIRGPASCNGVVGLKPTRGRNPLGPDSGDVSGFLSEHIISRSVRDTAAMLDATAGPELGDPYCAPPQVESYLAETNVDPGKLRIAIARTRLDGKALHRDCVSAVDYAGRLCEGLGHTVEEASPTVDWETFLDKFFKVWASGCAMAISMISSRTGVDPGPHNLEGMTLWFFEQGKRVTAVEYLESLAYLQTAARQIARWQSQYDCWLTPTLGGPPFVLGSVDIDNINAQESFEAFTEFVPFTQMQNLTGQPAINLPLYWNEDGLPIGVQFVGAFGQEALLLRIAAQIERAAPWVNRHPPIWK